MSIRPSEITLAESYVFRVTVNDESSRFAGELSLTPDRVILKVFGEETEGRKCGIEWKEAHILICRDLNCTFLLLGLSLLSRIDGIIEYQPQRSYFKIEFEAENVIYFPSTAPNNPEFYALELQSDTIAEWVGNTVNQEDIILKYRSGFNPFGELALLEEFSVRVANEGIMGVHYSASTYYSSPEFRAGIEFPPSLYIAFKEPKDAVQTVQLMQELYTLFAFVTGDELEIDRLVLHYSGFGFDNKASLFYPRHQYPDRNSHMPILFPLGRNLRFDTLRLPEFPLESFNAYFMLDGPERSYFHKYVRYRRRENVEERFLGYFRVLESLCYKQKSYLDDQLLTALTRRAKPFLIKYFRDPKAVNAFLRKLPKFNLSKYNTEKCIGDFFAMLPASETRRWRYQKNDLGGICRLRNNISHANDYDVAEAEMWQMVRFCEVLLVVGLFLKIGVSLESAIAVIDRMVGYHLITR